MALHGEIKVNHQTIGTWEARRVSPEFGEVNQYECEVAANRAVYRFPIEHRYDDGALALAVKVLAAAHEVIGAP